MQFCTMEKLELDRNATRVVRFPVLTHFQK